MRRRELSVPQLLRWADAHFDREGAWPNVDSGRVYEATDEKWPNIDGNLRRGDRGLPGGWSLAQMLDEFRGLRNRAALPPHSVELILGWADVHHERTGQWPVFGSGPIPNASGESWAAVNACLVLGGRGMPCGSSLAQLLKRERSVPSNAGRKKALGSGPNAGAWSRVAAKRRMEARAAASREQIELCREGRNIQALPPFTLDQILGWADSYHLRHGAWPKRYAGLIEGTAGETWVAVNIALSRGLRGLRAGSSLAQLLAERRGVHPGRFRRFTEQEVLALADAHHERSGTWPTVLSGPIPELTDVTWATRHSKPGRTVCLAVHRWRGFSIAIAALGRATRTQNWTSSSSLLGPTPITHAAADGPTSIPAPSTGRPPTPGTASTRHCGTGHAACQPGLP